jgi:twitching motility protein PilJ
VPPDFSTNIPQLQAQSDEVVRRMIETGAPTVQIYVAGRQLALADRMLRRVNEILAGGTGAITAADAFSRDAALFNRVLQGLINGDEGLNLSPVRNQRVLEALAEVVPLFEDISLDVETILAASTDLFEVRESADEIFLDAEELTEQARSLAGEYTTLGDDVLWPSLLAGLTLAAGALVSAVPHRFGRLLQPAPRRARDRTGQPAQPGSHSAAARRNELAGRR